MDNEEYFTEKIAPKKGNGNTGNHNQEKSRRPVQKKQSGKDNVSQQKREQGQPVKQPHSQTAEKSQGQMPEMVPPISDDNDKECVEIIGIRFKEVGKVYYFSPDGIEFKRGEKAIVETTRGVECGEVLFSNRMISTKELVSPLKSIIRKASADDISRIEENLHKEKEIMRVFSDKIQQHKLDMKPIDVEYTFDGSKILFYFTSEGRVDFRDLVKDLAAIYRTRIELRQIGVRDEAKKLGGLGICGRPFCCSSFLGEFQPVSIKMAKEQSLSLNPTKISGTCGRLMCCLKYEQSCYEEFLRTTPKTGAYVETPDGRGTVEETNLLTGVLKIKLDKKPDIPLIIKKDDVKVLKDGKVQLNRDEIKALKKLEEN